MSDRIARVLACVQLGVALGCSLVAFRAWLVGPSPSVSCEPEIDGSLPDVRTPVAGPGAASASGPVVPARWDGGDAVPVPPASPPPDVNARPAEASIPAGFRGENGQTPAISERVLALQRSGLLGDPAFSGDPRMRQFVDRLADVQGGRDGAMDYLVSNLHLTDGQRTLLELIVQDYVRAEALAYSEELRGAIPEKERMQRSALERRTAESRLEAYLSDRQRRTFNMLRGIATARPRKSEG